VKTRSIFRFIEHSIDFDSGLATFSYQADHKGKSYEFKEKLHFPIDNIHKKRVNFTLLNTILDNLLLILGISYYKLFCSETIETPSIVLTQKQAQFWETVYTKGLGEFFYKNNIDFRDLIHFPFSKTIENKSIEIVTSNRSLVFFGGGKDSIVSVEFLKQFHKEFSLLMVNSSTVQDETVKITGKETLMLKRELDKKLFELNKNTSFFNGHVPVTAIWDFIGLFAATLYDFRYLVGSNELSASFGNVWYLDVEINHQWSKSFECEKLLQDYVKNFITPNITYFSLLRPLHEIKIVELFTKYSQYFPYFSSCNRNFTVSQKSAYDLPSKHWCGECSKCLFVFSSLAAFLPKETIISVFGKNLFADRSLLLLFQELLGIKNSKPFECVGTPEEMQLALVKASQTHLYDTDFLMEYFTTQVMPTITNKTILEDLLIKTKEHTIPVEFRDIYEAF